MYGSERDKAVGRYFPEGFDAVAAGEAFGEHLLGESTDNLREFVVVNLSGDPDVARTETNLIFDHIRAHLAH